MRVCLILSAGLFLSSLALPQSTLPALQRTSYWLAPTQSGGPNGTLDFIDYGLGHTLIVVNMTGLSGGQTYPARIGAGSCDSQGEVILALESVDGSSGLSLTLTTVSYSDLIQGNRYVNLHPSAQDLSSMIACSNISPDNQLSSYSNQESNSTPTYPEPTTVQPLTPGTIEQTGVAQGSTLPTGVKPEEFATRMRTEGYGIYAVNNSNIYGQIQVAEEADGSTRIVVTLSSIQPGVRYGLELFQGDCGPGRPSLMKLHDLPSVPADPTASATDTPLTYDLIAGQNNFIYVYDPNGYVLACGEVGLGANR